MARDVEGSSTGGERGRKSGITDNERLDSPYKSSLKEINCQVNDSLSDEKDFMSPLVLPKKKPTRSNVVPQPAKIKVRQRVKREKKRTFTFQKTIEDSFKYLDVNADHLQMAVALSESTQLALSDARHEESGEELPTTGTLPRTSLRSTLEKFGFRHGPARNTITTLIPHEVLRKKKKSKFSHVTPTLLLRTEEDREALITSKVSQVLSEIANTQDFVKSQKTKNFFSEKLQLYYSETKKMFTINSMELTDLNSDRLFSTKSLLLSSDNLSCCGCLLRDWLQIPGREPSPPRTTVSSASSFRQCPVNRDKATQDRSNPGTSSNLVNDEFSYPPKGAMIDVAFCTDNTQRSVSPDLFFDDDQSPLPMDVIHQLDGKICSKYNLEEFEENNGICHYESFHENKVLLSQETMQYCIKNQNEEVINNSQTEPKTTLECYDLTLSSDDEQGSKEIFNHSHNPLLQRLNVSNNEERKGACPDPIELFQDKALDEKINIIGLDEEKEIIVSDSDEFTKTANSFRGDALKEVTETGNSLEDDIMNEDTIIVNNFSQCNSPLSSQRQSSLGTQKPVDSNNVSVSFDLNFSGEKSPNIPMINDIPNRDSFKVTELSSLKTTENNTSKVFEDLNVESCNQAELTFKSNEELQEADLCSSQTCSQELYHISDEELNYSSNFNYRSVSSKVDRKLVFEDCDVKRSTTQLTAEVIVLSDENSSEHAAEQRQEHHQVSTDLLNDSVEDVLGNLNITALAGRPTDVDDNAQINGTTPVKCAQHSCVKENTPKNNVIIKTDHITPIPDYDFMDTPKILKELHRFGVKPLKRQRGVQLLKYIYDSTHPVVGPSEYNSSGDEDVHRELKKQKRCDTEPCSDDNVLVTKAYHTTSNIEIIGDIVLHSVSIDELIFERRQSSRVPSCRIPLDIVWHNFVSSNQQIRENILLYEPLQLEVLHSMLKENGYKFHIQDLLTFLDRKCITVRVAGSQGHRKRKKLGT